MREQLHYEFIGMDPSDWTESFLQEEFSPLLTWAPQNSTLRLRVESHDDGMQGKLIVHSRNGAFVVEDHCGEITSLVKNLKRKMKSKLQRWKEAHEYTYPKAG